MKSHKESLVGRNERSPVRWHTRQLAFDSKCTFQSTSVPGYEIISLYHGFSIFVIFIQSLFFNHSEHKMLNISLFCLFCTQRAEHPELPINAANAAVSHHLPPFLVKEPFKTVIFESQIRMLLVWRDYFHRINLQILWLTPQHPQPILCPGFPRRRRTCSRHHQLEPTTSKERLVRVWVRVPSATL